MVNLNANVSESFNSIKDIWGSNSTLPGSKSDSLGSSKAVNSNGTKADFADAIKNYITKTDDLQQTSDMSVQDLLSGKTEDVASVVSAVAKADMSFKLLMGVRNKLVEAYKQTMNMPL